MRLGFIRILVILVGVLMIFACQTETKTDVDVQVETKVEVVKETPSVCVWNKGSVRDMPSRNAKWLSGMALGEKVVWTGETVVDSSDQNRTYHKVRLSDGTEGWASEYVLALDAIPGIVIKNAQIFRRPELITLTSDIYEPMSFVAILDSKDDWIQVKGEENKLKGWIKFSAVSTKDEDITAGLLAYKALKEKDPEKKVQNIQALLDNPLLSNSIFMPKLQDSLNHIEKQ